MAVQKAGHWETQRAGQKVHPKVASKVLLKVVSRDCQRVGTRDVLWVERLETGSAAWRGDPKVELREHPMVASMGRQMAARSVSHWAAMWESQRDQSKAGLWVFHWAGEWAVQWADLRDSPRAAVKVHPWVGCWAHQRAEC